MPRNALRSRLLSRLGPLIAASCLLLACSPEQIPATRAPRVISLSPSITEILVALGATDLLVGVDGYSLDVPGLGAQPSLGGLFAPDLERAIELRPTLVLGVESEQQSAFFAQLRARGVDVREFRPYTLEEVLESYREIGRLVGRDSEPLIANVRSELAALRDAVRGRPRPTVALVVERDPLYVAAGGTFVDELIELVGGRNVFSDLRQRYPQVSLELLAERAPEVLIDSTVSQLDSATERVAREYWRRFDWLRRVEFVEPGVATLPGARLADGARLLLQKIHPELGASTAP